jgi:membrane protease YdiL (CAAX protease family)
MIPNEPASTPRSDAPFWDYMDLLLFSLLVFSSLVLAVVISMLAVSKASASWRLILPQVLWYAFSLGSLKALFLLRYRQPFWRALGWRPISFGAALGAILAGPLLTLSVGLLGSALHMPEIDLPFGQMLDSRSSTILLGILVVILGPVAEELAFRGFLMPLLIRSTGAASGILLTGIIFGSVHGYEYEWSWQYMLLISLAGSVFGWAKYRTQSTVASALMHCTFNLTQFAALLVRSRTI